MLKFNRDDSGTKMKYKDKDKPLRKRNSQTKIDKHALKFTDKHK